MIKKVKDFFAKREQKKREKEELKKYQKYFTLLREGATFVTFIQDDLEKMKKSKMNRSQRRRWEKQIAQQGKFSPEMVQYYKGKVDEVLAEVDRRLNQPKPGSVKVDKKVIEKMKKKAEEIKNG